MSETIAVNFESPIPLFPLSNCVLLPHTALPLHVFEERYREMVDTVIDSHGLIAMAVFQDEVEGEEYLNASPTLRPIVCVGYISQYETLPDGRYLVVLHGLCRAEILSEADQKGNPYRSAFLNPTELDFPEEDSLEAQRLELETLLRDSAFDEEESVVTLRQFAEPHVPTIALVDLAVSTLEFDVEQRYAMLAEADLVQRVEWLIMELMEMRFRISGSLGDSPMDSPDFDESQIEELPDIEIDMDVDQDPDDERFGDLPLN